MSTHEDTRRTGEIESDIERARAEVSSTIDAIQSKLTPGQMMDQALQYLRNSGTGEFGSNLGRTVKENPVPVALIGVGVAWLMMGGGQRTHATPAWRDVDARIPTLHRDLGTSGGLYGEGEDTGAVYPASGLEDEGHEGALSRAASAAGDLGQRVKESATGVAERARGRLSDVTHDARMRAESLQRQTRYGMERTRDRTMRMIDEQPLVLAAVGIAIGAAVGAALPSTRREDALLGEMRDELMEGAKESAREGAETLTGSAKRVAGTVREETERALETATAPTTPRPDPERSASTPQ
jgi:ElaB/YqjD/DUF883 family membrane-anchored ribosome-binding protein